MMAERPVRVLLVAPSLGILGGQAVQASRLLLYLRRHPEIELSFQPINPDIGPLRHIKFVRTAAAFLVYLTCILARTWRYDVIHVFSASHWSYALWTLPALAAAKLCRRKIILNYRDGRAEEHLSRWRLARPTIRMMDLVVAPSAFLVEVFRRHGVPARAIFNTIDIEAFRYRMRRRLRPVFLHNRILEPLYNVECTLRAFRIIQQRYPDAQLTVAHDGFSRPALEDFARELGLRNTRFIGSIPHHEAPGLYDAADIYLTSPDVDCMPGSLLECFASGLPVIATAVGGIPYIARDEHTALLVPRDDHEAIARAAFRLLEDEALVERLTAAARDECRRYEPTAVAAEWLRVYEEFGPGYRPHARTRVRRAAGADARLSEDL
jgi:glycosyltransferase involved in cell wall biosynthesis